MAKLERVKSSFKIPTRVLLLIKDFSLRLLNT